MIDLSALIFPLHNIVVKKGDTRKMYPVYIIANATYGENDGTNFDAVSYCTS